MHHFLSGPRSPAATVGKNQAPNAGGNGNAGGLPFLIGSNQYREAPFSVVAQLLDASAHETVVNITPGGYLRGITMQVSSSGGVLGTTAALMGDSPWSILSSVSLEDISGGPILYPMTGYAYMVIQKYFRPWAGDPAKHSDFSNTINPAFTLRFFSEVFGSLGVLANTDARAQYRFRYTLAALTASGSNGLVTVSTGVTAPTVTVKLSIETWSQPDLQDLLGNPIAQVPPGIVASRFNMHEIPVFTSGTNVIRATLTGNEIRALGLIVRDGDSPKTRKNLTDANTGAIDARLDNRRLWKMNPTQLVEEMSTFYPFLGAGTWTRDTGVYVYPRFGTPEVDGTSAGGEGEYWLQTVEQTLLQFELSGGDLGTSPGSIELVYDVLAVAGAIPHNLEGI